MSTSPAVALDSAFAKMIASLPAKLASLLASPALHYGELPRGMATCGVYLFTEGDRHMYVGRSNVLRGRYGRHCRPGATHRQASFAFQLAREATGRIKASYRDDDDSRDGLMRDATFVAAFLAAKERIRAMEYRFMEETDQTKQALLEIYCAVVLNTPYNDFGTH